MQTTAGDAAQIAWADYSNGASPALQTDLGWTTNPPQVKPYAELAAALASPQVRGASGTTVRVPPLPRTCSSRRAMTFRFPLSTAGLSLIPARALPRRILAPRVPQ